MKPEELPQDRWFWVWLTIFGLLFGTCPFILWQGYLWSGIVSGIVGLGGLFLLIRDRLADVISRLPIVALLKVFAVVALSIIIGQMVGYDVYRHVNPPLGVVRFLIVLGCMFAVVSVIFLAYGISQKQSQPIDATRRESSKLVIHYANYRAWQTGGDTYDVTEFLRKIISGDSLVFNIENHNFVIAGQNFVPKDPLSGKAKRLRVSYSYNGEPARTVERSEHSRMVLPEDSQIAVLETSVQRLEGEKAAVQEDEHVLPRMAEPSWVRFIRADPEQARTRPAEPPATYPLKLRSEFMNCTDWSYKVRVLKWTCGKNLELDILRSCLQLRIVQSWCPDPNGVEELHVPPGDYFRIWAFPKDDRFLSFDSFKQRVDLGDLGTIHFWINGQEVAVKVG
jgi:hypothetical protein